MPERTRRRTFTAKHKLECWRSPREVREAGARLLAADVNAVRVTHAGAVGTLTVIGHSYGSTTTGLALQRDHMQVDQVALIGSPGVGGDAQTVAGLHLLPSQVCVGAASRDIVTMAHALSDDILGTDTLGANPALDAFGATAFKAESVNRGFDLALSDHSRYYDAAGQSESLYALADIATGHGDRLGADGIVGPTTPRGRHRQEQTAYRPALRRPVHPSSS